MATKYLIEDGLKMSNDKTIIYGVVKKNCPVIIELPDTIEVIEDNAFAGCKKLMKITLSKSLKRIGDKAFYDTGLKAITIPKSVEHIGKFAIGCECRVQKGNKVYETDGRCLYENTQNGKILITCFKKGILEYTVAEGTVEIEESAFIDCSRLRKVELPDSVVKLGDNAFAGTKPESFNISAGLIDWGTSELDYFHNNISHDGFSSTYCTSTQISVDSDNPIYWADSDIIIKKDGDNKILLRTQKNRLQKSNIPEGVTHIRYNAFIGQRSMSECNLPDTLKEIGATAFMYCEKIEHIVIPEGTEKLCRKCFANCTKLRIVTFKGMNTEIAEDVFENCKTKLLVIECESGSTAEKFGKQHGIAVITGGDENSAKEVKFNYTIAKNRTAKLTGYVGNAEVVEIPAEVEGCPVTSIHKNTFRSNSLIRKVIWPSTLSQIPKECFWGCINLNEVEFPSEIELTISTKAFYNCRALKEINIPANVIEIGEKAFSYAENTSGGYWWKGQCVEMIYGTSDSAAMKYADDNNVIFIDTGLSIEEQNMAKKMSYHEVEDGISLDRFEADGDEMIIPDTIADKPVVELSVDFNEEKWEEEENKYYRSLCSKVKLPKFLKRIDCPLSSRSIDVLEVHPDNHEIIVDEAAWYEDFGKTLKAMWKEKGVSEYHIKEGTLKICDNSAESYYLKNVYIPDSVTHIEKRAFGGGWGLTIHASAGSYAEKYANENRITFVAE